MFSTALCVTFVLMDDNTSSDKDPWGYLNNEGLYVLSGQRTRSTLVLLNTFGISPALVCLIKLPPILVILIDRQTAVQEESRLFDCSVIDYLMESTDLFCKLLL